MSRIHIIGGPGSGKTTLAQHLTATMHIPHYELDVRDIHVRENGTRTEAFVDDAFSISEQPGWITDGIFLVSTEPFLFHADYIVFLKVSWPVAAWRVIYRHISKSLQGTNRYPGINSLKLFLKNMRCYYLNQIPSDTPTVASIHAYMEEHKAPAEPLTREFMLMYFEKYQSIIQPPTEDFVLAYLEKYREKLIIVKNKAERKRLLQLLSS